MRRENRGSSWVEVGPSVFLLSGDAYVGDLLKLPQGCQGPFRGSRGKVGFLSRCCSRKGPHLALRGEFPGFSRVGAGNLRFLLSYDRDLRDLLVLPQESPVSMRVARGLPGFPSSQCRGGGPHLELRTEPHFLTSADMDLGVPMEFSQGSKASSCVETCKSAFLSSCNSSIRLPVGLT